MALPRYRLKPTDVWSVKERLALASSVMRSGDQNWVSVSRAVKPFGESNRPPEWFSQKNCALQYTDLLEKVDTPRRKRSERGELRETPGDVIMRKLTIERIEELKRLVQQEQEAYKWCKKEWEMTQSGDWDSKVKTMYEEIEETRVNEAAAAAAAQKPAQDTATKLLASKTITGKTVTTAPVKPQRPDLKVIIPVLDFDESTLDSNSGSFATDDSNVSVLSTASTPQPQTDLQRPPSPMLSSLLASSEALEALQAEQKQQLQKRQLRQELQSHIGTTEEDIKQEEDNDVDVEDIHKIQIKIEPIEQIKEEPVDVEVEVDSPIEDIQASVIVKQEDLGQLEMVETVISPESDIHVEVETEPSEVIAEDSSISSGVPTLSRLLNKPPSAVTPPSTMPANQEAQPDLPVNLPPSAPPPADTSANQKASENEEIREEEEIEEEEDEEDEEPETKQAESVKSDVEDLKEELEATETPEPTPDMKIGNRSAFDFEEPPSPASSVLSNDTDGGSGPSRGRAPSRRGRGGKANFGRRPGRPRKTDDESEKNELSSKRSEAETSDDEGPNLESDDAVSTRHVLSAAESVPNSPASINPSDTEAEKEHKIWKKSIMLVWRSAANHKYANVFLHPVTNEIAPGYRNVVFRPMNLSSVKKNIESGVIRTTSEFQRDMMLMFTNAIMYNSSDHDVYNMAVEMYNDVMVHIEQFMNTQMMVQSEQKVLRASSRTRAETISDKEDELKKRRMSAEDGGKTKKRKSTI